MPEEDVVHLFGGERERGREGERERERESPMVHSGWAGRQAGRQAGRHQTVFWWVAKKPITIFQST